MTDREYLETRGWTLRDIEQDGDAGYEWTCHASPGECYAIGEAVRVQKALDAAEERACVAAAIANAAAIQSERGEAASLIERAATLALTEYRARFAVEVEP